MVEIVDIRHIHHLNVGIIESPAFEAPPPKVLHGELIPQDIRNAMRGGWDTKLFAPRTISVDKLFDVIVTEEGLVFTSDGRLIAQTITQHSPAEQQRGLNTIQNATAMREISTSCLLMRKRGDHNYGHWLVEIVPRLALARSQCHVSGLAIPALGGHIKSVMQDTIGLCDRIGTTPRFELEKNKAVFFKELIVVWGATQHGSYMSPYVVSEIEDITKNIDGSDVRRVFVSRRGSPRNVADQDAFEDVLKANGFHIVTPGSLSFYDQVRTFKNAEIIVGVMGAGMTNILFAKRGAKIINLSPSTMPDTFFYFISLHKKHNYCEIRGNNISQIKSWDQKFEIDVNDVLDEIK